MEIHGTKILDCFKNMKAAYYPPVVLCRSGRRWRYFIWDWLLYWVYCKKLMTNQACGRLKFSEYFKPLSDFLIFVRVVGFPCMVLYLFAIKRHSSHIKVWSFFFQVNAKDVNRFQLVSHILNYNNFTWIVINLEVFTRVQGKFNCVIEAGKCRFKICYCLCKVYLPCKRHFSNVSPFLVLTLMRVGQHFL